MRSAHNVKANHAHVHPHYFGLVFVSISLNFILGTAAKVLFRFLRDSHIIRQVRILGHSTSTQEITKSDMMLSYLMWQRLRLVGITGFMFLAFLVTSPYIVSHSVTSIPQRFTLCNIQPIVSESLQTACIALHSVTSIPQSFTLCNIHST